MAMDPQLLEYRQKQRKCFLNKAEAPAPTKLVELLLAAAERNRMKLAACGVGHRREAPEDAS